jgi:hypothetical protein
MWMVKGSGLKQILWCVLHVTWKQMVFVTQNKEKRTANMRMLVMLQLPLQVKMKFMKLKIPLMKLLCKIVVALKYQIKQNKT